ncbi:MAG: hypothetical protein ABI222_11605, partial [Opitutaceae bacterium]
MHLHLLMIGNLILAVISSWAAIALWPSSGHPREFAAGFAILALWQLFCATRAPHRSASPFILRLGGFSWTLDDFCRGWLITGQIGTGKTSGAINTMLWQISRSCPNWGGV